MMATDFDPDASNFSTKNQMENYEKCVAFEPYARHVVHDVIEAASSRKFSRGMGMEDLQMKNYFVNGSANQLAPITNGAKFYDVGNFQVGGSSTVDGTSTIGELWVEYSFTMIRPIQDVPLGDTILTAHYLTTPVTATSRFLTSAQQTGSNLTVTFAANTMTLPYAGNFFIFMNFSAATSYTDANAFTAGTNGTLLSVWCNAGVADGASPSPVGSGTNNLVGMYLVSCTAPGVIMTYAGTPTIVGATRADIWVTQVPSDIVTFFTKKNELSRLDKIEHMLAKLTCRDDWRDSKLELDYCNSRVPPIPSRFQDEDTKSQSSLRSQGLFRNK